MPPQNRPGTRITSPYLHTLPQQAQLSELYVHAMRATQESEYGAAIAHLEARGDLHALHEEILSTEQGVALDLNFSENGSQMAQLKHSAWNLAKERAASPSSTPSWQVRATRPAHVANDNTFLR